MTGWLEYAIFTGVTTAVTIIVKKLQCKYNENALTVEMIVEVAQRTGKELSDREVDIIADTTKEMGHDVGKV